MQPDDVVETHMPVYLLINANDEDRCQQAKNQKIH